MIFFFIPFIDAKKVTNCQFNRFTSKALDISNHQVSLIFIPTYILKDFLIIIFLYYQPTLPRTSTPTKQTDNVTVSREGSEQSTKLQSENDEINKTSEGNRILTMIIINNFFNK